MAWGEGLMYRRGVENNMTVVIRELDSDNVTRREMVNSNVQ
jgi:hypothetical protein